MNTELLSTIGFPILQWKLHNLFSDELEKFYYRGIIIIPWIVHLNDDEVSWDINTEIHL